MIYRKLSPPLHPAGEKIRETWRVPTDPRVIVKTGRDFHGARRIFAAAYYEVFRGSLRVPGISTTYDLPRYAPTRPPSRWSSRGALISANVRPRKARLPPLPAPPTVSTLIQDPVRSLIFFLLLFVSSFHRIASHCLRAATRTPDRMNTARYSASRDYGNT